MPLLRVKQYFVDREGRKNYKGEHFYTNDEKYAKRLENKGLAKIIGGGVGLRHKFPLEDIEKEVILPNSYSWVGLVRLALATMNRYRKDKYVDITHPVFNWCCHVLEFEYGVTKRTIIREITTNNEARRTNRDKAI